MHNPIPRSTWYSLFGEPDRFPHYRVDGVPYFSKFDAMVAARDIVKTTSRDIHDVMKFRCFDKYLGAVDFSKEPEKTYQELCISRALQLRMKYKYIRLWYSGGVDSHTTLMSFYRAGTAPDEICFMSNKSWDSKEMGGNLEYEMLSVPMQEQIRLLFPNTKQRVITFHYDFWKTLDTTHFHDILYKACITYPLGRDIPTAFEIDQTLMDAVNANPNSMCELCGEPKIYLFKKDGEWWTSISDFQLMNMICVPNLEMFHLSPDFPDIYVKQCHMVRRGYEELMGESPDSYSLVLDTDVLLKNKLLQRRNEFDLMGINALDTQLMKYRDIKGDRLSVVVNADLMKRQDHTKKLFAAYERIYNQDMYDWFSDFVRPSDATYKDTRTFRSSAWCLTTKKTKLMSQLWKNGYGKYDQ